MSKYSPGEVVWLRDSAIFHFVLKLYMLFRHRRNNKSRMSKTHTDESILVGVATVIFNILTFSRVFSIVFPLFSVTLLSNLDRFSYVRTNVVLLLLAFTAYYLFAVCFVLRSLRLRRARLGITSRHFVLVGTTKMIFSMGWGVRSGAKYGSQVSITTTTVATYHSYDQVTHSYTYIHFFW